MAWFRSIAAHEFKAFVGYQIPKIEVGLNAVYRGTSGVTYTPFSDITAATIDWTASNDVQIEPQGSYRNDPLHIVDLRLEKVFRAGFNRFGVYADIENLFNAGTAITAQNRYPSAAISGNTVLFGSAYRRHAGPPGHVRRALVVLALHSVVNETPLGLPGAFLCTTPDNPGW